MNIRICMINDEHYPHKSADTINVVRTASALGAAGAEVDLVVPWMYKGGLPRDELSAHYGVPPSFNLIRVPSVAPITRALRPEKLTHGLLAPWLSLIKRADVVYSRNVLPLMFAQLAGKPWVFETYRRFAEESSWLPPLTRRLALNRALGVIAHSERSANSLETLGFERAAILVAYSGYLETEVEPRLDRAAARAQCGLDINGPVVLHLGNIDPYVRIDQLFDIAERLPDVTFLFVGGYESQHAYWRERAGSRHLDNIRFVLNQPPANVRQYLYVADVLAVVPRNADLVSSGSGLSLSLYNVLPGIPMKIMLYAATGIPIFSPDLPYLREVLKHDENSVLYPIDDPEQATSRLRELLDDAQLRARLSAAGMNDDRFRTWADRGRVILEFLKQRLASRTR